jgi:hypothetical protein
VTELDRPRTVGELIRDTLTIFATSWRAYLTIGFAVVAPVYLAVFGIGLSELSGPFDGSPSQERSFLEGAVLFALILPLVMVMVARVLIAGESTGRAMQGGFERFAAALVTAVLAIACALAGLFALVLPGIYLAIRLSLAVPAVALEELGPIDAMRRSWALTRPHLWRVLGLMALVVVLTGLLEALVEVPLNGIADATDHQAVALIGAIVSYAITLPLAAIAVALILFDVRARETA